MEHLDPQFNIRGAPNDDDGADIGCVYNLFLDRTGSVQGFEKISNTAGTLTPGNVGTPIDSGDLFGQAASNIGDLDNDGLLELAVGAPGADGEAGAVWLLSLRAGGTVMRRTVISTPDLPPGTLDAGDGFGGRHVANIGDLDGDGIDEIAVGAFRDDDGGTDQGALYTLFLNEDLSVRETQKISSLDGGFSGPIRLTRCRRVSPIKILKRNESRIQFGKRRTTAYCLRCNRTNCQS